jgi:23S rRNA pseudouridine1911/1915/1917 synthase
VQGDKTGKPLSEVVKNTHKYNKPGEVFLGVAPFDSRLQDCGFARTSKALTRLNELFKNRKPKKRIGQL